MRPLLHTAIMCWQGSPSTRGTPQLHVPKNEPLVSFPGIRVVYLLDEVRRLTTQQYVSPCVVIAMLQSRTFTFWNASIANFLPCGVSSSAQVQAFSLCFSNRVASNLINRINELIGSTAVLSHTRSFALFMDSTADEAVRWCIQMTSPIAHRAAGNC